MFILSKIFKNILEMKDDERASDILKHLRLIYQQDLSIRRNMENITTLLSCIPLNIDSTTNSLIENLLKTPQTTTKTHLNSITQYNSESNSIFEDLIKETTQQQTTKKQQTKTTLLNYIKEETPSFIEEESTKLKSKLDLDDSPKQTTKKAVNRVCPLCSTTKTAQWRKYKENGVMLCK